MSLFIINAQTHNYKTQGIYIGEPEKMADMAYVLSHIFVWAIPITSTADWYAHSEIASPSCPERLVIFESDTYHKLNRSKYMKMIQNGSVPVERIYSVIEDDIEDNHAEFVAQIENVIFDFSLDPTTDYDDDLAEAIGTGDGHMEMAFALAFFFLNDYFADAQDVIAGKSEDKRQKERNMVYKRGFEDFMLALVYILLAKRGLVDGPTELSIPWTFTTTDESAAKRCAARNRYVDWEAYGDCDFAEFDKLYEEIKSYFETDYAVLEARAREFWDGVVPKGKIEQLLAYRG